MTTPVNSLQLLVSTQQFHGDRALAGDLLDLQDGRNSSTPQSAAMYKFSFLTTCLIVVCLNMPACVLGQGLSEQEQRIVAWVDQHQTHAIQLLEDTVNIGSGTMNHQGVRAVGDVMAGELEALGLSPRWIDMPEEVNRAGHLFARQEATGPRFLLIGHLDTVFEADDPFQAFSRDGDIGTGPGISDMKSGNVVIVYALKALAHIGALENLAVTVAYTGDEEKPGRPLSVTRKDLVAAGRWADIALGFEGAITTEGSDWATIARRSSSSWILETTGRQAHSSAVFSDAVAPEPSMRRPASWPRFTRRSGASTD